jgi:hypothetical protein
MTEKFYYLGLGQDDRTGDFEVDMLHFIVNLLLSKPCAKRMRTLLDGVYSIQEILNGIFGNSDQAQTMTVSNGTYQVTLTIAKWNEYIDWVLANFTEENCIVKGFKKTAESAGARELISLD